MRDFSDLQPREVITIPAILFGKSRSHLSKKSAMTYLKQILHKTSQLLFYQTRIDIKLEKLETYLEIINLLFSECSPISKTDAWKSRTLNIQIFVFDHERISKRWFKKIKRAKGYFNPQLNKQRINFVVPSYKILNYKTV